MSSRRFDGDPLAALRKADPVAGADVPTDTSGVHARALFEEITTMESEARPSAAPRRIWVAVAASALVVAAAMGAVVLAGGDAPEGVAAPTTTEPTVTPPEGGVPIAGMCLPFTYEMLADFPEAFDGTVTSIGDDDVVTFEVHRWFKGGDGASVTLHAYGMTVGSLTSIGEGILFEGGRFLVSGGEGAAAACGFTMEYDADEAARWEATFSG